MRGQNYKNKGYICIFAANKVNEEPGLSFWRDSTGNEVDLLRMVGGKQYAYEIKSGATYSPDFFKGISKWAKLSNTPTEQCFAIYNGDKDIKTSVGQVNGWNHFSLF